MDGTPLQLDPGRGKALVEELPDQGSPRYVQVDLATGEKKDLGTDRAEAERRFNQ